jgi:lambda family phage portal protein
MPKPTMWDKTLAAFGLQRRPMSPRADYRGAAGGRLMGDFRSQSLRSADQIIRPDGLTLRARARELVLNNATAARVPALFSENVIGKDGITLQARVKNSRGDFHEANNTKIEDAWDRWCEADTASADGQRCWTETETLVTETECVDGEVLIRLLDGFDNEFGFTTELIDVDQLDWTYNVFPAAGVNEVRMGVELNQWRRPVAYHILTAHLGEGKGWKRERVPAEQIIHLFIQRRVAQTRGVTWFAPVIVDLNNLGMYREAELIAARTAAAKMGFLQQKMPEAGEGALETDEKGNLKQPYIQWDADPGVIEQLPGGWEFQGWDPTHPTTAFAEFDKAILRSIATGLRVSYLSLSSDLSDTSFGSGRIGMLAERAVYQAMQQRFIKKVEQRVYRRWLRNALLSGAVQLDSFDAKRYEGVMWHPRTFPWIDPQKDIEAKGKEVAMGFNSLTRIAAEQGRDLEDVFREREEEIKLAEKYNVPLALDLRPLLTTRGNAQLADANTTNQPKDGETERPNTAPNPQTPAAPPKNGNGNGATKSRIPRELIPIAGQGDE